MVKVQKNRAFISVCIAACAVCLAVAMMAVYFLVIVPPKTSGEKTVSLKITYQKNSYEFKDIHTSTETVLKLLQEQDELLSLKLKTQSSALGEYLISLCGVDNDDAKGYYYMFLINGVYSNIGVSNAAINDGDVIEFQYGISNYDDDWNVLSVTLSGKGTVFAYTRQIVISAAIIITLAAAAFITVTLIKNKKTNDID